MGRTGRWSSFLCAAALLAAAAPSAAQLGPVGHVGLRSTGMYEGQALLVGGGAGVTLGARTRAELIGYGPVRPDTYGSLDFNVAYGGVRLERDIVRAGPFALAAALQAGLGWFWIVEQSTDEEERTGVYVAEPEFVVGVDLGPGLQLAATASHRWVRGVEGDILNRSDGDASGFAFGARLSLR